MQNTQEINTSQTNRQHQQPAYWATRFLSPRNYFRDLLWKHGTLKFPNSKIMGYCLRGCPLSQDVCLILKVVWNHFNLNVFEALDNIDNSVVPQRVPGSGKMNSTRKMDPRGVALVVARVLGVIVWHCYFLVIGTLQNAQNALCRMRWGIHENWRPQPGQGI